MRSPRYLVTGAAGFIGSNLVAALTARGEPVRALDNLATGHWGLLGRVVRDASMVDRITADIRDSEDLVSVGAYVQVVGTGDAGFLNLRAEPSIDSPINYLAIENEVFQVQAGPTNANGFDWWYLVDPATNTRFGWAVQNYLQVVQAP